MRSNISHLRSYERTGIPAPKGKSAAAGMSANARLMAQPDYRIHMTEGQYRQLRKYMALARLNSTTHFRHLIRGNTIRAHSRELKRSLHASLNKIHSNIRQIARHQRTGVLDAEAAARIVFPADKLCEEMYLPAAQK